MPGSFCWYQVMPKLLTCGNPQIEPVGIHSRQAAPFLVHWRCYRGDRWVSRLRGGLYGTIKDNTLFHEVTFQEAGGFSLCLLPRSTIYDTRR